MATSLTASWMNPQTWTQPGQAAAMSRLAQLEKSRPPNPQELSSGGGNMSGNGLPAYYAWNNSPEGKEYAALTQQAYNNGWAPRPQDSGIGGALKDLATNFVLPVVAGYAGGTLLAGAGAAGAGAASAPGYVMPGAAAAAGGATGGIGGGALTAGVAGAGTAGIGAGALGGAAAPAATTGALGGAAGAAGASAPWWSSAIGPAIGGGLSLYGANSAANKLSDAANNAAQQGKFTPYNVYSGAGAGMFDANGNATATLSPEYQALRNQYLQNANGNLSALQNYDPQAAANTVYGQLSALSAPQEEQDRLNMENRLLAQGMLGSTGGGIQNQALLTSQGLAGVGRQVQSWQMGQDVLNQMQNRALGATNAATALDAMPLNNLNMGGAFGGRAQQGNQFGANLQYNAAGAGAGATASFWQGLGQQVSPGITTATNNYFQQNPWGGSPYVPPTQAQANSYYGGLWTGN